MKKYNIKLVNGTTVSFFGRSDAEARAYAKRVNSQLAKEHLKSADLATEDKPIKPDAQ